MNERIHVGQGMYDGRGLTVFPVWLESDPIKGYCWNTKHVAVTERSEGATVNSLTVTNTGHRPHIVLEGDIFEGGMQNRVLTRSLVLNRGESQEVPVACVEEGRWSGAREHSAGRRRAPVGLRYGINRTFSRMDTEYFQDSDAAFFVQGQVWDRIRHHEQHKGSTPDHSLIESMDLMDSLYLTEPAPLMDSVRMLPGQRGVIIGIGGEIASAEFFGHSDGLASRFEAIVAAARYEAIEGPARPTSSWRAREFSGALDQTALGKNLSKPKEFTTSIGPVALSSFSIAKGLIHASVFNGAHPLLAEV